MQTGEVTIYGLTDPRTGDVRYVGKGADPVGRRRNHIWRAKAGYQHHKDRWIAGLLALGLEPGLVTLDVVPAESWQERERFWIASFSKGQLTNISPGGGCENAPRTPEWSAKIGAAHRGKNVPQAVRDQSSAVQRARHAAGCKNGHAWTPENTKWVVRNGRPYRSCRECFRLYAETARRAAGKMARAEYEANREPSEFCRRGHAMTGDNLRLLTRVGRVERICRQCTRERNARYKKAKKEAGND